MADAYSFATFPVSSLNWRRLGTVISGGPTLSGPGQLGKFDGGGWWGVELGGVVLETQAERRAWTALLLALDEGLGQIEMGYLEETPMSGTTARFAAAAADRATTVQIERQSGFSGPLQPGTPFSVANSAAYDRLHIVKRVVSTVGSVDTVEIRVPLRQAVALNQAVDFNAPRCLMRLDDPEGEAWPTFDGTWTGSVPRLRFLEVFPPPP